VKLKKQKQSSARYYDCNNSILNSLNNILFLFLFIKIQKIKKKKFRIQKYIFSVQPSFSKKKRAYWVNTGQTVLIGVKNEFHAVLGQNHHFQSKPSSPSQYRSNHVDRDKK